MSEYIHAVATIVIPASILFLPGITLVKAIETKNILRSGSYAMLTSLIVFTLGSFLVAAAGLPIQTTWGIVLLLFLIALYKNRAQLFSIEALWALLAVILPILLLSTVVTVPFIFKHSALPTGDSQKAIIWAQEIIQTNQLPAYQTAIENLNRDAGDFFTPGLHTLTATIMQAAPHSLTAIGLFSIMLAVVVIWLAATISRELFDDSPHIIPPLLAAFFVISNTRFLRYVREPGYHFQNIVGEVFLFGLLFLSLRLLKRITRRDSILWVACGIALILSHQFSVFMAAFALLPLVIAFLWKYVNHKTVFVVFFGFIALAFAAIPFRLYEKLPHLFTTTPHLASLTPDILDYPAILNPTLILFGIPGLLLLAIMGWTITNSIHIKTFVLSTILILALSQGPKLFIDIPPVRALFYSVVPLSICAAYFVMRIRHFAIQRYVHDNVLRKFTYLLLTGIILIPGVVSTAKAFSSSNHSVRTNSTLVPEQLNVIDWLEEQPKTGGVLIDDYNRRSSSWFVLSGKPMYTRIAADIHRQMNEARQSEIRNRLYLKQLDFEKMYSLGSKPYINQLAAANNINWISGVEKSSQGAFQHNPVLTEEVRGKDSVVYSISPPNSEVTDTEAWLLRASTLANDIGDREDTFAHLPASLRASRVSDPQFDGLHSLRFTDASVIPLIFNARSYVEVLWDQDGDQQIDTDVAVYIEIITGPSEVTLRLPNGDTTIAKSGEITPISHEALHENDKGLLEIQILNPNHELVGIDLIALGLSQVP